MSRAHAYYFRDRVHDRWFDRICHFLLGAAIFGMVVGVVVSQGRAQQSLRPGITNPSPQPTPNFAPVPTPTTGDAGDDDIRDIHGPVSIPYAWLWIIYLTAAILSIAAMYALWRWYKNHRKERAKLPHELALEALERARALMRPESVRAYSFALSEAIRNYIEARFDERAAHRTTEEFLHDLVGKSYSPLAAHSSLLEDFLTDCDLVKFARYPLNESQMDAMHASAKNFVLATRPLPETPEGARSMQPAHAN